MKGMTVQRLLTFYEDSVKETMDSLKDSLVAGTSQDESLVRSAQSFVRNGAVQLVDYRPVRHEAKFIVRDVQDAYVEIGFYDQTTCSCSATSTCRHTVATFFYLYQHMNSLSDWVRDWKATADQELLQNVRQDRTPLAWEQYASSLLNKLVIQDHASSFFLMEFALTDYKRQMQRIRPLEREWHVIFDTSVTLMTLVKLWPVLDSFTRENERGRVRYYLDETVQELTHQFHQLASQHRFFAADPFYERIERYVRHLLIEVDGYFMQRSNLYSAYWTELGTKKAEREKELSFLESHSETKDGHSLVAIRQLFYLQMGNKDKLLSTLHTVEPDNVPNYLGLIRYALDHDQHDTAAEMIEHLLPAMEEFFVKNPLSSRHVYAVRQLELQVDLKEDSREHFCRMLIPHTLEPYSDWLIEKQRFKEWQELHLFGQSTLSYAERCGLDIIKIHAPEMALPIYHLSVIREIEEKKRDSYKQAVRHLKKMKQLAKASNEITFWNAYIQEIREKFRRLRAFQQEMEKGNLSL